MENNLANEKVTGNDEVKREELFEVNSTLRCIHCGHVGAVRKSMTYYPKGMGNLLPDTPALQHMRNEPYLDIVVGSGGVNPWECTNCKSFGLADKELSNGEGYEGFVKCFDTIVSDTGETGHDSSTGEESNDPVQLSKMLSLYKGMWQGLKETLRANEAEVFLDMVKDVEVQYLGNSPRKEG